MHIDLWSVGLQTVNFLVLLWLLQRFLFRPVLALVEQRRKAVEATLAGAEATRRAAEEVRADYDGKRAAWTAERERLLADLRAAAAQERAAVLERAALEAGSVIESGRSLLRKEEETLADLLAARAGARAVELARTLLEGTADAGLDERFLARLEREISDMPAPKKDALLGALGDGTAASIVTAHALDGETRDRWRRRLAAAAAPLARADFGADPALIAGAEIRYPLGLIGFTWRQALDEAHRLTGSGHAAA